MKRLCILLISVLINNVSFGFIIQQTKTDDVNRDTREPVFDPEKCKDPNQLLYPVDQDWKCDCGPGFIYYPPKDACFVPFREGPCNKGYHLIFIKPKKTSECLKNPCKDGFAKKNGKCYELGKPNGPCKPVTQGGGIFDVNSTTLEPDCLEGTESLALFGNIPPKCAPGSKMDMWGNCRNVF